MPSKKFLFFVLALIAIGVAIIGVWNYQKIVSEKPVRQSEEIR